MNVHVSARKITFPRLCPCCSQESDTEVEITASRTTGKRVVKTVTKSWEFPYCKKCMEHTAVWNSRIYGYLFILISLAVSMFTCLADVESETLSATFWLSMIIGASIGGVIHWKVGNKAKEMCSSSCAAPGVGVEFLGWDGAVQSFSFTNQKYALAFMSSNRTKLQNLTHAQIEAMEEFKRNNAVSQSSEPKRVTGKETNQSAKIETPVSTEKIFLKWIEKLEAAKGPASRKAAIAAALKEIIEPKEQERFLMEASRIEVQIVMDKVDGLKTTAAKKRNLEAAIENLENDDIPDHMQTKEMEMLRNELESLE